MVSTTIEERRSQLLARLQTIRESYSKDLSDLSLEQAAKGGDWSAADLVHHVNQPTYRNMLTRILQEDDPQLGVFEPQAFWARMVNGTLGTLDEVLETAKTLPLASLERPGYRGSDRVTALDILERIAAHYEEHLAQLRDEVRLRLGL